jgi:Tfp pilus assembly protein PilF
MTPVLSERSKELFSLLVLFGATAAVLGANLGDSYQMWDLTAYQPVIYAADPWRMAIELMRDLEGRIVPGYYAPLSSISLMLDKFLVGSAEPVPKATLMVNIGLHCLNGALVFALLRILGAALWAALIATFLFLLHPVQASSVLWFAQRKGLLSALCYLLSFIAYVKYMQTGRRAHYFCSLLLFPIGLLNKPTIAILPLALGFTELVLGWGALARASASGDIDRPAELVFERGDVRAETSDFAAWFKWAKATAIRLAPFFAVAAGFALIALRSEGQVSGVGIPLRHTPFIASSAIWFYVGKILAPVGLCPFYPLWEIDLSIPAWWVSAVSLAVAILGIIVFRRRIGPSLVWALGNFVIPLLPAIGFVKFAFFELSYVGDHFLYIAMMAASYAVAMGICAAVRYAPVVVRYGVMIIAGTYLLFLAAETHSYTLVWKNSENLWLRNLACNPESIRAHNFLGHAWLDSGKSDAAAVQFARALELTKRLAAAKRKEAEMLDAAGLKDRAADRRGKAESYDKAAAPAHYNLGNALLHSKKYSEAITHYEESLRLRPGFFKALQNAGAARLLMGNLAEAERYFRLAIEVGPTNADVHYSLGVALKLSGREQEAERFFKSAEELGQKGDAPHQRRPAGESDYGPR